MGQPNRKTNETIIDFFPTLVGVVYGFEGITA